ncbi:MAG: cytochrome c biogenesis protein ResB [Clostridia bacterium]|nr:cytochrome c biogenesis protein ResB [Clostridia bacterium]
MEKLYRISCLVLAAVSAVALAVTLYVGATGASPVAATAGLIVVIICLASVALLTAAGALFIPSVGSLIHRIGHYVMHFGAVVLIVGLVVTELATTSNARVYTDEYGAETTVKGDLFRVGRDYDSVLVGDKNFVRFGAWFSLDGVQYEQYEDGTPKRYEATVVLKDKQSGLILEEKTLTVNHPQYIDGYKIYLMNVTSDSDGAVLYIKNNPAEYVVIAGVAALITGTFLSCFTGLSSWKKKDGEKSKEARDAGRASRKKGGDAV